MGEGADFEPPDVLWSKRSTRFFIYKHQQLSTEPGWCLFSNRFCPHFHPTPTPIYVLKMHLVESPACINEWIAINRSEHRFSEKNWAKFQAGGAYSGGAYK